jgi:cellulose synthase/poly-beta-1,6-N-acetylglucosamine synthase-like glycosyltransferase
LIAARNEENNLENCINSLLNLNYPKEKLTIFFGNDGSNDHTEDILKTYCSKYAHLHYINIIGNLGKARAKANVLAQLINITTEEYIFVTDADIMVKPNWINDLLPFLTKENYDMVSGTTFVKGEKFLERMQGLEWLLVNAQMVGFDRLGIKTTAVGNNMAFTRQAYIKTGGYENMEYSVTEDYQLYKHILQNKGKTLHTLRGASFNISSPPQRIAVYLHQRKRWLTGARSLPNFFKAVLLLYALFFPLVIVLIYINWFIAILLWSTKFLVQTVTIVVANKRLNQPTNWMDVLAFEVYININIITMIIFYLLPIKMVWKNRIG